MMDVGLVNDGPVGVDYRCIDEAVHASLGSLKHVRQKINVLMFA